MTMSPPAKIKENLRVSDQNEPSCIPNNHTRPRILILEDNDAIARLMQLFLEEEGYEVRISERGRQVFNIVSEFEPDLITLDILLPDVDGLHIFRQLKSQPLTRGIPIVFVTALEDRMEEGLMMGAQGFVPKPFVKHELNAVIDQVLKEH